MATQGLEYRVLSQQATPVVDIDAWNAQARRFFGTSLSQGATGAVVLVADGQAARERMVTGRAATPGDLALASAAEARASGGGLAELARRCPTVWLVERSSSDDATALLLAAVLASVHLGPILDPRGPDIFGVKTARALLERLRSPDR